MTGPRKWPISSADVDVNYASQYRLRLITAELIHSTRRGYVDFALPYLREYLRDDAVDEP